MSSSAKPNDLYFVGPVVDAFCMGFASILCFLFYRITTAGQNEMRVDESAVWAAAFFAWLVNWPHFSATAWRLYETRENAKRFPVTAYVIPVIVALAALACFVFPASFAPGFVKLYVLWSPWHYSLQAFGITMIYARRAGLNLPGFAKRALGIFFVTSFLVHYAELERSMSLGFLYSMFYPQLDLPAFAPAALRVIMYSSLAVASFGFLPEFRKSTPWIVLLPIATQYLWFVHGSKTFSFQLLVPLFHCLQYLLIAWAVEVRLRAESGERAPRAHLLVSLKWLAGNIAGGAVFFWGIPKLLAALGWDFAFSTLVLLAAVSVHHFFVDGVIWKLRKEGSGSSLLSNVAWAWTGVQR